MVVLVTGMHRSGTSAIAELLIAGGLDGGPVQTLMPASSFNARGHFEQLAIVELNDRILAGVDAHWMAPPRESAGLVELAKGDLGAQAQQLVADLAQHDSTLVLKDPRFCLTLPFWREVLQDQLDSVVLIYRNAVEVASSLLQRNAMSPEVSRYLWRAYNQRVLDMSNDMAIHVVGYQALLEEPRRALSSFDEVTPGFSLDEALSRSSLEPQLRNHVAAGESFDAQTKQIFDALESFDPRVGEQSSPTISDADVHIAVGLAATAALERTHQRSAALWSDARAILDERVGELESERDQARAILDERVGELESERDQARAALDQQDQARAALEVERDEAVNVATQLAQDLDTAHGVVISTTNRLEGERDHAREAHRLTGQQLESVRQRLSDYEGSRAAGFARRLWQTKRRLRRVKAKAKSLIPGAIVPQRPTPTSVVKDEIGVVGEPVDLPRFDEPVVSIVIPVYGQLAMTAACLESIVAMTDTIPYEVVVVDDCSPDTSLEWLRKCQNLVLVENESNQGYLRSTNAGAAASGAPFVCLLNNDTKVTKGWLEALLRLLTADELVGAVGAKLVYPDGSLQEAGAIIFDDGSGWNFGRNGDPEAPEVNFVREVDYCSAACLLVRRSCWEEIGGFDERFVPAYYEDTDLAFELRARGWKVLYQPAATVIHFEGVSHGTDDTQGLKAHQVRNKTNFQQKWAEQLAHHSPPGSRPRIASWRGAGKRVLVIDHEVPAPDQDAGSLRMAIILELLVELGYKVSILPHNRYQREPYASQFAAKGIEVLYGHISVEDYLEEVRDDFALVVISRPDVATDFLDLVRTAVPEVPIAYDMVDFHGLRMRREAELTGDTAELEAAERTTNVEMNLARAADVVIAVTEEEATLVRQLDPSTQTAVLPTIHAAPRSTADFGARNGLMFIGSYRHGPNRDAIDWLFSEILPEIWKLDATIEFHLIGSDLPDELMADRDSRVTVHGWLPHLDGVFDQVRLNIAPLRFGAGIKGKVGDSLARGVPVVCTDIAAEGFGPVADVLSVGMSASELARLVVEVHNDEQRWTAVAQQGIDLIEQYFGLAPARRSLVDMIEQLSR